MSNRWEAMTSSHVDDQSQVLGCPVESVATLNNPRSASASSGVPTQNMRTLKQLSISTRLALGIGFVIALLVVQSVMGFLSAGQSQTLLRTTVADARTSFDLAVALSEAIARQDLHLRQMGVLVDRDRIEKEVLAVREATSDVERVGSELLERTNGADGRALIEQIVSLGKRVHPALLEATRLYATLQVDQGNDLVDRDVAPASAQRRQLANEFTGLQQRRLDGAFDTVGAVADKARMLTVFSAIGGIIAGLLAGFLLYGSITRALSDAIALADAVAEGDLTRRTVGDRTNDEVGRLLSALDRMSGRMSEALTAAHDSTQAVHSASAEIASGNTDLSTRTEQQASALQQAAVSVAKLAQTQEHNATAALRARELAGMAACVAADGGQRVDAIVTTMNGISDSSRRMSDIVGVIDGIAFQTNILALNAAVEAARAGEQGRGFAVVASEVRTLAQRSASAAREIKQLIAVNDSTVTSGVVQVRQAGLTIRELVQSVEQVAAVVTEISGSAASQANSVREIEVSIARVDEGVQQNAALVRQSAAAAESLRSQAGNLATAMGAFRLV